MSVLSTEPQMLTVHVVTQSGGEFTAGDGRTPMRSEAAAESVLPVEAAYLSKVAAGPNGNSGVSFIHQPEPRYFLSRELTERPQVLQDVPSDLGLAFTGVPAQTAVLRLFINEQGNIDRVVVEHSYLPEDAARALTDGFLKMKFRPGKIGGTTVKSQMEVEVSLDSTLSIP